MKRHLEDLYKTSHLSGSNASYFETYYEDWLEDEASVPTQWAEVFSGLAVNGQPESGHLGVQEKFRQLGRLTTAVAASTELSDFKEASVVKLITAYRIRGHEVANLNPLGEPHHEPVADLDPAFQGLDTSDLDREFDTAALFAPDRMKLRDIIRLCGRILRTCKGSFKNVFKRYNKRS